MNWYLNIDLLLPIAAMLDQMSPMYPTNQLLKIGVAQRPSSDGDSFKNISDAITRALQDAGLGNIP